MKKVLIAVAPVAGSDQLINPRAIARDVYDCWKHGACMVHLHVRDIHGGLTPNLALVEETVRYIRSMCDILIEISTGGVSNLSIEDRIQPVYAPWPEAVSLNVGSVNLEDAVYQNPIKDVRYCVQQIVKYHKVPETELFEVGMAATLRQLVDEYHVPKPLLIALVCGHEGEMPATPAGLRHLVDGVYDNFDPRDVIWGYTEAHRKDWKMVETALDMGAQTLRLGFEDSDYLDPDTRVTANSLLIERAEQIVRAHGMEPMTPAECRQLLGLSAPAETAGAPVPDVQGSGRRGVERADTGDDMKLLEEFTRTPYVKDITVLGSGLKAVGLALQYAEQGRNVQIITALDEFLPGQSLEEQQKRTEELKKAGVRLGLKENVAAFPGQTFIEQIVTDRGTYPCDLCICTGK